MRLLRLALERLQWGEVFMQLIVECLRLQPTAVNHLAQSYLILSAIYRCFRPGQHNFPSTSWINRCLPAAMVTLAALAFGGLVVIEHFALRFCLRRQGAMPMCGR